MTFLSPVLGSGSAHYDCQDFIVVGDQIFWTINPGIGTSLSEVVAKVSTSGTGFLELFSAPGGSNLSRGISYSNGHIFISDGKNLYRISATSVTKNLAVLGTCGRLDCKFGEANCISRR